MSNKSEKELNSFIEKCNMEEKEIKNLNKKGIKILISCQKFMNIKKKFNKKLDKVRTCKKKKEIKEKFENLICDIEKNKKAQLNSLSILKNQIKK